MNLFRDKKHYASKIKNRVEIKYQCLQFNIPTIPQNTTSGLRSRNVGFYSKD